MKATVTINHNVDDEKLQDSIQSKLLKHIDEYPGIRYRELLRLTDLANGVLTYHLSLLERSTQIRVNRSKAKTTRYYPINITSEESEVIGYIRNEPVRRIILFILEHNICTFNEIVDYTNKAPSTISWHLKKLKDAGIISVQYGQYQLYRVTNREVVAEILYKYRQSFVEQVVDNYTEIIEEL
jgi:predicted transcriptional regulator